MTPVYCMRLLFSKYFFACEPPKSLKPSRCSLSRAWLFFRNTKIMAVQILFFLVEYYRTFMLGLIFGDAAKGHALYDGLFGRMRSHNKENIGGRN